MLPTNYHTEIWHTPKSDSLTPARFLIRPMNYGIYANAITSNTLTTYDTSAIRSKILDFCVIAWENVEILSDIPINKFSDISSDLPMDTLDSISAFISEISYPTQEELEKLNLNIEIAISPTFSGNSWDCKVCQERRLDRQRNCTYLSEEFQDPKFTYKILDIIHTTCPIALKETAVANEAIEAYSLYDKGFLPEPTNIKDQTIFFVLSSRRVDRRIKHFEKERMDEMSSKSKTKR